jgi:hypothetical protein
MFSPRVLFMTFDSHCCHHRRKRGLLGITQPPHQGASGAKSATARPTRKASSWARLRLASNGASAPRASPTKLTDARIQCPEREAPLVSCSKPKVRPDCKIYCADADPGHKKKAPPRSRARSMGGSSPGREANIWCGQGAERFDPIDQGQCAHRSHHVSKLGNARRFPGACPPVAPISDAQAQARWAVYVPLLESTARLSSPAAGLSAARAGRPES